MRIPDLGDIGQLTRPAAVPRPDLELAVTRQPAHGRGIQAVGLETTTTAVTLVQA